uniref:Uncharacterized protein n=1 Tax=Neobodo designis TaxID=312471 RepID=A0A7S1QE91_NEODS
MAYLERDVGFVEEPRAYDNNQRALLARSTFAANPQCPIPDAVERCDIAGGKDGTVLTAGTFCEPSLASLRAAAAQQLGGRRLECTLEHVVGDIRDRQLRMIGGGVVQAASQFNYLEFPSTTTTPEDGVAGYIHDRTQGPACATFAAAGTLYRNYLVKRTDGGEPGRRGQRREDQLNGLRDVEAYLAQRLGRVPWAVRNGYIAADPDGLDRLNEELQRDPALADELAGRIRFGVQLDTESTWEHAGCEYKKDPETNLWRQVRLPGCPRQITTTQIYCSAIGIGYDQKVGHEEWEPFARVVLRAAYEATLLVGAIERVTAEARGIDLAVRGPADVHLTLLGHGVFDNPADWVRDAMLAAVKRVDAAHGATAGGGKGAVPLRAQCVHFQRVASAMEPGIAFAPQARM